MSRDEVVARMMATVDEANRRIENCHEEVACPKCRAPVGERCCKMPAGFSLPHIRRVVKHPHRERWTLVVPAR